jgi:hypothetical protein
MDLTDRERALLEALRKYDSFKSVPVLQHYHPELKRYTKGQLFSSAKTLVDNGLALRTVTNPEREARYRAVKPKTEQ